MNYPHVNQLDEHRIVAAIAKLHSSHRARPISDDVARMGVLDAPDVLPSGSCINLADIAFVALHHRVSA